MSWWNKKLPILTRVDRGKQAEKLAYKLLSSIGFKIIERNARYPVGEIDIIALDGNTLCFVEVRSTGSREWGGPLESITDRKRKRLIQAARWDLKYRHIDMTDIRFDVVAIDWNIQEPPNIELMRGAFEADAFSR